MLYFCEKGKINRIYIYIYRIGIRNFKLCKIFKSMSWLALSYTKLKNLRINLTWTKQIQNYLSRFTCIHFFTNPWNEKPEESEVLIYPYVKLKKSK